MVDTELTVDDSFEVDDEMYCDGCFISSPYIDGKLAKTNKGLYCPTCLAEKNDKIAQLHAAVAY